ncbi:crk-like protein [Ptychodera flava]|uniref:crk-like protein n=1 Tax=Ptychodera flava TaxID=63121 RepID=UPI00396A3B77
MAANFDSKDDRLWYFGKMPRLEAQRLLNGTRHGRFLVRDSATCPGDYVLSVSENAKVSHYIINRIPNQAKFKIGDQIFDDLPSLIEFYKIHYLDTTTLIEPCPTDESPSAPPMQPPPPQPAPAETPARTYKALFDFPGRDPDDLPFRKGEMLTLIREDEENWWTMKNAQGKEGSVPVPYIERFDPSTQQDVYREPNVIRQVTNGPVKARVIQQRIPSAYDPKALRLDVGDTVTVVNQHINGQWEGEVNGRVGTFPCTYVEIIQEDQESS